MSKSSSGGRLHPEQPSASPEMTLTKTRLIKTLESECGMTRKNAAEVVASFTRFIVKTLQAGEEVRIRNFGRFRVVIRAGRGKQNLSSEGALPRPTRKVVSFKCSKILMAHLQEGDGGELRGFESILEQLYRNLEIPDRVQEALNAHCRRVESRGSEGNRVDLSRFELKGADLFGNNLRSATLCGASLSEADLSDCDLENACLENADLKGASLAWANLRHANLRGACLRETDLRWADLRWADFSEADLSRAHLGGAEIENTIFKGAELRGVKLKDTSLEQGNRSDPATAQYRMRR